jgi:hypothetical protein
MGERNNYLEMELLRKIRRYPFTIQFLLKQDKTFQEGKDFNKAILFMA